MGSLRRYVLPSLWAVAGWSAQAAALDPLAPAGPGQGRVFSADPGGTVTATVIAGRGRVLELADGEPVRVLRAIEAQGDGEGRAVVIARRKQVTVPSGQVVTADRLSLSPDRRWGILVVPQSCVPTCRAVGWLIGRTLRQLLSTTMTPEATVAWRPDSGQAAVASDQLYVVTLPKARVAAVASFVAPRYTRDGRLLLRSRDNPKLVYQWKPPGEGEPVEVSEADLAKRAGEPIAAGKPPGRRRTSRAVGPGRETRTAVGPSRRPANRRPVRGRAAAEPGQRALAQAANTRAYRLLGTGDVDQAIPLFESAAALDATYALPRYNLARIYAQRGDARECARWLRSLRGKAARRRLPALLADEAFAKVADAPEIRQIARSRGGVTSSPGTSARGLSRDVRRIPAPPRPAVRGGRDR